MISAVRILAASNPVPSHDIKDAVAFLGAGAERLFLSVIPSPVVLPAVFGIGAIDVVFPALRPMNAYSIEDALLLAFDKTLDVFGDDVGRCFVRGHYTAPP